MVTPITNDKILASEGTHTSVSNKKSTEQGGTHQTDPTSSTVTPNDTTSVEANSVDVERANQIFSQSQSQASREISITTPEQARLVAADIRGMIEENGLQALQAQSGPGSANLSALLEAAPV